MSKIIELEKELIIHLYDNIDTGEWIAINELLLKSNLSLIVIKPMVLALYNSKKILLSNQFELRELGGIYGGVVKDLSNTIIYAKIRMPQGVEYYNALTLSAPIREGVNIGNIVGSNVSLGSHVNQSLSEQAFINPNIPNNARNENAKIPKRSWLEYVYWVAAIISGVIGVIYLIKGDI